MQRFAWLPQGRPQSNKKWRPGYVKMTIFFAIVVRITRKLLYIDSWNTKCAVSSEREGLRTSNLVDGRSLDLRKSPYLSFYLEQHSATNQSTQQHEASRGLSAIAELLVIPLKVFTKTLGNRYLWYINLWTSSNIWHLCKSGIDKVLYST